MTPTRRIALILTLVFLIPALFFSVYEISTLNRDERMIADIYQKQLEAILFSVNQYSDDVLSSWISKTEVGLSTSDKKIPPPVQNLLELNSAIYIAFDIDKSFDTNTLRVFSLDTLASDTLSSFIVKSLKENRAQINQLIKYKKSGFQKPEVIPTYWKGIYQFQLLVYITGQSSENFRVAGFLIDPETFIIDLIGPRLQTISRDQFILSVYNLQKMSEPIYCTLTADTASIAAASLTRDFWIFKNYALGIRTQGASLQEVVRSRTEINLSLLLGLDVILIIALVFVFRNVKREVQLAQNKTDFVSNVSHEIRTPLALISMFAETLEMNRITSEEKRREYYSIISKETQRLTGIVNKILSFSQAEAGKKVLHIEAVELSREVGDLLKTYDFHLKNKGFEYVLQGEKPVLVMADRESLTEMIINLIDNAIKYGSDKKKIDLVLGKDLSMGWIAIRDYGEGISETDQKHIFDKFYRVSTGNLAKVRGTGLGLSFVKQLIEQQNGRISVKSELGKGSTFTLYFPLVK